MDECFYCVVQTCKKPQLPTISQNFPSKKFLQNSYSFLAYSFHLARTHRRSPSAATIAKQQDWREWEYLIAVVIAEGQDARTVASYRATPAVHLIRRRCRCQARNPWFVRQREEPSRQMAALR
jgi:hypothetical protein